MEKRAPKGNSSKSARFAENCGYLIKVKRSGGELTKVSACDADPQQLHFSGSCLGVNMCRCELIYYPLRVERIEFI